MALYVRYQPLGVGGGGGGGGGSITMGALDGTSPSATDGAVITGGKLYVQSASQTEPGLVNLTSQSFTGIKTFLSGASIQVGLNMNSAKITSLLDPTAAQDGATKHYVDSIASSLNPIQAAYAASTANIAGTYLNGTAGVGATFTVTATGALSIDGVSPSQGSRILLKNQTSGFQNGVYDLTVAGSGGISPVLTRSLDYNTASNMNAGDLIPVINGTANATTSWLQTATIATVGTDSLVFAEWTANPASYLLKANNLSDVASPSTAFNNISPMTTGGDLIYGGASGAGTRLANGSAGQVLTSAGGTSAPTWATPSGGVTSWYLPVAAATTDNTLASGTYNNGTAGVGATLTKSSSGALPAVDGVTLSVGDRVLVKNSTGGTSSHRGIYTVTDLGSGGTPWILTRATDNDSASKVFNGGTVYVAGGSQAAEYYTQTASTSGFVVGTASQSYVSQLVSGITNSDGTITVTPDSTGGLVTISVTSPGASEPVVAAWTALGFG